MMNIEFNNIFKSYPGNEVLKGVSFSIELGTIHGFLGPNGAGKSTLMNILLEIISLDKGEITLPEDLTIGYLPENLPLYKEMRVWEYLCFIQDIYDKTDRTYLEEVISKCSLQDVRESRIDFLSRGFKQRVSLAGAMCHNPGILVLDEPFLGLDPHAVIQMKEIIVELSQEHTIFISSHQLHELQQLCTHVSILHRGKIIRSGTLKEVETAFRASQIIEVEFGSEYDIDLGQLGDKINVRQTSKNTYTFESKVEDDIRPVLSEYFLKEQLVVLSQAEKKLSLEDIFKEATGGDE